MELKKIKKCTEVLLEELKSLENEHGECEISALDKVVGCDNYMQDEDNVYVKTLDGLFVIPYDTVVDSEHLVTYEILCLSISYLAKNEIGKINDIIKRREEVVQVLQSCIDEESVIGEILDDGTVERGYTEQGMVYKNPAAFRDKSGVCYVPELSDDGYTYEDFFSIANSHEVAKQLFEYVDWQSPETLYEQWLSEGEVHMCKQCEKGYLSYEKTHCPYCNAEKELD